MKKCTECPKPAVYHITEVGDGDVKKELHFCEEHFHDYMTQLDGAPIADDLDVPQAIQDLAEESEVKLADNLSCPNCGITFREFRESGRLGCPLDYDVFREQLLPLLENIHGETEHTGKIPKSTPAKNRQHYEIIRLRRELADAVKHEAYEAAAKLRDEIQAFDSLDSPQAAE